MKIARHFDSIVLRAFCVKFLTEQQNHCSLKLPFEEAISTVSLTVLNGRTLNVSLLSVLDGLNQGHIFPAHFLRAITGHLFDTTKLGNTMQPQNAYLRKLVSTLFGSFTFKIWLSTAVGAYKLRELPRDESQGQSAVLYKIEPCLS